MANKKNCDVDAKNAFVDYLNNQDFVVLDWEGEGSCPADIYARSLLNGENYFFEIKKTAVNERYTYFGAATLTEWEGAYKYHGRYFFVIAFEYKTKNFHFYIISPERFIRYSCIPPFKVFFNIPYELEFDKPIFKRPGREDASIVLEKIEEFSPILEYYGNLKKIERKKVKKEEANGDFFFINQKEDLLKQLEEYEDKNCEFVI